MEPPAPPALRERLLRPPTRGWPCRASPHAGSPLLLLAAADRRASPAGPSPPRCARLGSPAPAPATASLSVARATCTHSAFSRSRFIRSRCLASLAFSSSSRRLATALSSSLSRLTAARHTRLYTLPASCWWSWLAYSSSSWSRSRCPTSSSCFTTSSF